MSKNNIIDNIINILDLNIYNGELDVLLKSYFTSINKDIDMYDMSLCVVPGLGGNDAIELSSMIFNMYKKFLSSLLVNISCTDSNIHIHDDFLFKKLYITENITYKIIRLSPFSKKRETSYVKVIFNYKIKNDIIIDEKKLKMNCIKSSGPGGQNVNKTNSAVRINYDNKNFIIDSLRSQQQNKILALDNLKYKLQQDKQQTIANNKKVQYKSDGKIAWGNHDRVISIHNEYYVKDISNCKYTIKSINDINMKGLIISDMKYRFKCGEVYIVNSHDK